MTDATTPWHEPMHTWFGLSYAAYLILPRIALQSAPQEWQERFIQLLDELREMYGEQLSGSYTVQLRDDKGRFVKDPQADYRHARRLVRDREEL